MRGEDWTSESISHLITSSLVCREVGFNVLDSLIDSSLNIYTYSLYFLQFHCLQSLELHQKSSANSIVVSSGEECVASGKSFQCSTRISAEPHEEMLVMHGMPQPLDHHDCLRVRG